jgi:hypothetical protein
LNRAWIIGVGLVGLVGLAILVLVRPVPASPDPEARAMRQLRDASIRPVEVQFLRASPRDPDVVCGLAVVQRQDQGPEQAWFVSTPSRVILGREGNPAVIAARDRYCRGVFQVEPTPTP